MTLNVYSAIGMLMLFGIVKKNSILQVDYTNTLRAQGMERHEAIIAANHVRLRPILMTTMSIVAGMMPIAFGRGAGAGSRASMAVTILGGQVLCLLLTLLVTPVVYSYFDDLRELDPLLLPPALPSPQSASFADSGRRRVAGHTEPVSAYSCSRMGNDNVDIMSRAPSIYLFWCPPRHTIQQGRVSGGFSMSVRWRPRCAPNGPERRGHLTQNELLGEQSTGPESSFSSP